MRRAADNSRALSAFLARKVEIDTILRRLSALSSEHFNALPDAVTWADVGTLESYLQRLRAIRDEAFREGEHAA